MELPGSAGRDAARMGVTLLKFGAADLIQGLRPGLEGNLVDLNIGRQIVTRFTGQRTGAGVPISELTGRCAEHGMAVGIAWSRTRGWPLRRAAATAATTALSLGASRRSLTSNLGQ